MTALGRKRQNGRCILSNVANKSSTRVVSAKTMTAFIIERPRRNGITSDLIESPPNPGNQCSIARPQPAATAIMTAIRRYNTARSFGRSMRSA